MVTLTGYIILCILPLWFIFPDLSLETDAIHHLLGRRHKLDKRLLQAKYNCRDFHNEPCKCIARKDCEFRQWASEFDSGNIFRSCDKIVNCTVSGARNESTGLCTRGHENSQYYIRHGILCPSRREHDHGPCDEDTLYEWKSAMSIGYCSIIRPLVIDDVGRYEIHLRTAPIAWHDKEKIKVYNISLNEIQFQFRLIRDQFSHLAYGSEVTVIMDLHCRELNSTISQFINGGEEEVHDRDIVFSGMPPVRVPVDLSSTLKFKTNFSLTICAPEDCAGYVDGGIIKYFRITRFKHFAKTHNKITE